MNRPLAFIFDLDGTLIDSRHDIVRAQVHALGTLGLSVEPSLLMPLFGEPLRRTFARVAPELGHSDIEFAVAAYRTYYREHCADETKPFDGVVELLESLKSQSYVLGVATTKFTPIAEVVLSKLGLTRCFTVIQGTDEAMRPKPEPDVLLACAQRLGAPAPVCAAVGDTPNDVRAAKAAGMISVAATWDQVDLAAIQAENPHESYSRPAELLRAYSLVLS